MPQELQITTVLNGWIVRAGCQILVFSDHRVLADEFRDWLKDPAVVETKYRKLMDQKGIPHGPPPEPPQSVPQSPHAYREQYGARGGVAGTASHEVDIAREPGPGRPVSIGPASQA